MQIWVIAYADVQLERQGAGWDVTQVLWELLEDVERGSRALGPALGWVRAPGTHPEEKQPRFPEQGPLEVIPSKHFKSQGGN